MVKNKEIKDKIKENLEHSSFKWRTAKGIAKDINISTANVEDILLKSDEFIKSKKPNSHGVPLFTTRKKYKNQTSLFTRVMSTLTNTAGIN